MSIDFHRHYRFFLFRFNFIEKGNGQEISFVRGKRKGIQRQLLIFGAFLTVSFKFFNSVINGSIAMLIHYLINVSTTTIKVYCIHKAT